MGGNTTKDHPDQLCPRFVQSRPNRPANNRPSLTTILVKMSWSMAVLVLDMAGSSITQRGVAYQGDICSSPTSTMCPRKSRIHPSSRVLAERKRHRHSHIPHNPRRPRGLMAKAPDFGSRDCAFDSHRGRFFFFCISFIPFSPAFPLGFLFISFSGCADFLIRIE
jgi:hypothetical protein